MGVAGATLMPSLFSLLRVMFADDGQRRTAIAVMMSAFSVGGLIGPLVGGVLLEWFEWGAVFLVNVPAVLILVVLGRAVLPEREERNRGSIDLLSILLSSVGILAVVSGLQELATAASHSPGSVAVNAAIAAAGVVLIALFVRRQRRLSDPLLDISIVTERRVASALITMVLTLLAVVGTFFLFAQHLQWVIGLSALEAGIWTLPYVAVNIAGALLAPTLARIWSARTAVVAGLVTAVAGMSVLFAILGPETPAVWIVAAMAVTGLGQGVVNPLVSDLIISSAPIAKTGSAASVQEVAGELGSAFGIAAAGAIGTLAYRASLVATLPGDVDSAVAERAGEGLASGVDAAAGSVSLLDVVHAAGAAQFRTVAGVAVVLLLGAVIAAIGMRREP